MDRLSVGKVNTSGAQIALATSVSLENQFELLFLAATAAVVVVVAAAAIKRTQLTERRNKRGSPAAISESLLLPTAAILLRTNIESRSTFFAV